MGPSSGPHHLGDLTSPCSKERCELVARWFFSFSDSAFYPQYPIYRCKGKPLKEQKTANVNFKVVQEWRIEHCKEGDRLALCTRWLISNIQLMITVSETIHWLDRRENLDKKVLAYVLAIVLLLETIQDKSTARQRIFRICLPTCSAVPRAGLTASVEGASQAGGEGWAFFHWKVSVCFQSLYLFCYLIVGKKFSILNLSWPAECWHHILNIFSSQGKIYVKQTCVFMTLHKTVKSRNRNLLLWYSKVWLLRLLKSKGLKGRGWKE